MQVKEADEFGEIKNVPNNTIYLKEIDLKVYKIIKSLKSKKSAGYVGLRSETLKHIAWEISTPFRYLMNSWFETGI